MRVGLEDVAAPSTESRRRFLRRLGAVGTAGLAAPLLRDLLQTAGAAPLPSPARAAVAAPGVTAGSTPLQHIIISCQENHSFDTYFGYYPNAGGFGVPPGYTQPDGSGGSVTPHHFPLPLSGDPGHDWASSHGAWDNGQMDGFYTTNGKVSLGYYERVNIPFYYSLADSFTLCGNYFCSLLGPTDPNRLYLCSGTSGGNTSNNIALGSLTYPMILDVLDQNGITFKNYNIGLDAATAGNNGMLYFANWVNDPRLTHPYLEYYSDLANGTLPQVCFFTPNNVLSEHPPTDINFGGSVQHFLMLALMNSPYWQSSAFLLTYDEGGGFFDHVAPPVFDAYGAGFRVPMLVVSPYAKRGVVQGTLYEHSSVLKFIETVFNLPTLASINHQFDTQTPGTNNDAANGQPYGPPAPPRDGRMEIGDLTECFDFNQNPDYRPRLAAPTV